MTEDSVENEIILPDEGKFVHLVGGTIKFGEHNPVKGITLDHWELVSKDRDIGISTKVINAGLFQRWNGNKFLLLGTSGGLRDIKNREFATMPEEEKLALDRKTVTLLNESDLYKGKIIFITREDLDKVD